MAEEFPSVAELIQSKGASLDAAEWKRMVSAFRPGLVSWLRATLRERNSASIGEGVEVLVDQALERAKPQLIQQADATLDEVSNVLVTTLESLPGISDATAHSSPHREGETHSLEADDIATKGGQPDETFAAPANASRARLLACLPELPESLRRVIALRHIEDMKYKLISDILEVPVAQVISSDREGQALVLALVRKRFGDEEQREDSMDSLPPTIDSE